MPERKKTAYTFFTKENFSKIKESQSLSNIDAMKYCAEQWSRLDEMAKK
jgi:hypothetical protein